MNESRFLRHEPCPWCGSKDNLGVWDDGHTYCFGCHNGQSGSNITKFRIKNDPVSIETKSVYLPEDSDTYIPASAREWLGKYDITEREIISNRLLWSEYWQQLIFPYFNKYNQLEAWQGRSFKEGAKKWFTQGNVKTLYHILPLGEVESGSVVLCEDIVSAIKLSRITPAMPVFGSNIGLDRFKTLYNRFKEVRIWLDPNMKKQMLLEAKRASLLGLSSKVVFSEKDPKEHSDLEIKEYLNDS